MTVCVATRSVKLTNMADAIGYIPSYVLLHLRPTHLFLRQKQRATLRPVVYRGGGGHYVKCLYLTYCCATTWQHVKLMGN